MMNPRRSWGRGRTRGTTSFLLRSLTFLARLVAVVFVLAWVAGGRADEEAARFVLHTAAGKDQAGVLKQIGAGWKVLLLEGDEFARGSGEDLISLRREKTRLPARPSGEHLILANGDALPGEIVELVGENLSFKANTGAVAEVKVPLSAVSVLWLAAPDGTEFPDKFRRELTAGKRARDTVYLRNGDVVEGVIANLDRKRVQVEVNNKDVTIEFAKVAAVALNTDLARLTPPKGPHGRVVLANGGRLTLASARCDGTTLTGKTVFGADLKVPVSELVALTIHGGAAIYLSDLKPAKEEATPFLDVSWPTVADASVVKRDLRLGGSTYDKGLGMRASRITYALGGEYRRFEARVGLDERSPSDVPTAAHVRVLVDGKAQNLGPAAELTRIGVARPLSIDVTGARELTLIVEFAGTVAEGKFLPRVGAVPGHVDWVEARVVKKN
jgi:hypothetical protein